MHTTNMVSEIHTKISLLMNSILNKGKNEGRYIKFAKSQDYTKLYFHEFHLSFRFCHYVSDPDNFVTAKSK
jgi:hypothetical protein